jgi:hypothetical protein
MAIADSDPSYIVLEREDAAGQSNQARGFKALVHKLANDHNCPVRELCRSSARRFVFGTSKKLDDAQMAKVLVDPYHELQKRLNCLSLGLITSRERDLKPVFVALSLALTTIYAQNNT